MRSLGAAYPCGAICGVRMKKRSPADTSAFLVLARSRKKQADDAEQKQLTRELADLRFLVDQWPQELQDSRAGEPASGSRAAIPARPCLSIDTLRDPIAHVKAEAEQTDLGPELTPADDFGGLVGPIDDTEIELREGLVRKIQRESDARDARNWAADRARKCGRGYYLVMTRYTSARSMDQEVYVDRLYNQSTVRLDPRHEKPTGSDAEWEFWARTCPGRRTRPSTPIGSPPRVRTTMTPNGAGWAMRPRSGSRGTGIRVPSGS